LVELLVDDADRTYAASADRVDDHTVRAVAGEKGVVRLEIDGLVHEATVLVDGHEVQVAHEGHTFRFTRPDPFAAGRRMLQGDGVVTAPMPGTMLNVSVTEGDTVEAGQALGVLEAMKMELSLAAPFAGRVVSVATAAGQQVALGAELFVVSTELDQRDEEVPA